MTDLIVVLVLFLFPLAYSPGPGNLFFAANGARFGFRATIPANLGYHVATWLVTVAIGFGFVELLDRQPHIFTALKIAGSAYVLWLAWKLLRSGILGDDADARPASFVDGVVLLVLNPKAYVIMALMLTQFLNQSDLTRMSAVLIIATIFTLNNCVAFSVWAMLGDRIATQFRSPASARKLNMALGTCLALVALWMLIS